MSSGGGSAPAPVAVPESPLKIEKKSQVEVQNPVRRSQANETYSFRLDRKVYKKNGILCVYAEHEDTYESIALEFNLFQKEILRFNDVAAMRPLKIGEVVYLKAKKRQAPFGLPMYVADDKPLTLWEISQRFGIKMKFLLKWNPGMPADYQPVFGHISSGCAQKAYPFERSVPVFQVADRIAVCKFIQEDIQTKFHNNSTPLINSL